MKIILALFAFLPILSICQSKNAPGTVNTKHVTTVQTLTVQGAFELAAEAKKVPLCWVKQFPSSFWMPPEL